LEKTGLPGLGKPEIPIVDTGWLATIEATRTVELDKRAGYEAFLCAGSDITCALIMEHPFR